MHDRRQPAATPAVPSRPSWDGPQRFALLVVSAALLLGACGGSSRLGGGPEALVGTYELVELDGNELPYFKMDPNTRGCFNVTGSGGAVFQPSGEGIIWFDEAFDCRPPPRTPGAANRPPVQLNREEIPVRWSVPEANTVIFRVEGDVMRWVFRSEGDLLRLSFPEEGEDYLFRRR